MAETTETEVTPAAPPPPFWVGLVTWVAVGLTVIVLLEVIGILLQASALKATGLSYSDKLGYSFLQNLDQSPVGFMMIVAVLLTVAPTIARQRTTAGQDRAAQVVIIAVAALAFIVMLGGIIGVPARVHILHLSRQKVTPVITRVLFTFVIRNVGSALLALAAAVGAVRVRFTPTARVAPAVAPPS